MEGVLDLFLAAMVQNSEGYHSKRDDRPGPYFLYTPTKSEVVKLFVQITSSKSMLHVCLSIDINLY